LVGRKLWVVLEATAQTPAGKPPRGWGFQGVLRSPKQKKKRKSGCGATDLNKPFRERGGGEVTGGFQTTGGTGNPKACVGFGKRGGGEGGRWGGKTKTGGGGGGPSVGGVICGGEKEGGGGGGRRGAGGGGGKGGGGVFCGFLWVRVLFFFTGGGGGRPGMRGGHPAGPAAGGPGAGGLLFGLWGRRAKKKGL